MDLTHEIFEGTPEERWLEILFHANRTLAQNELLSLLERLSLLELSLDSLDPSWEERLKAQENLSEVKKKMGSLAIESMGRILSQNE